MSGPLPAALSVAAGVLTHRIAEVPVRDVAETLAGRHRIQGTLTVAHGAGRAVALAWVRTRRRGPVHVLVGGVETGVDAGEVPVGFPPGARGRPQTVSEVESCLGALSWSPAQLALDATTTVEAAPMERLEDLFALSGEAMGFLVLARPLSAVDAGVRQDAVSDEIARLEVLRAGRGVHRRQLARAEAASDYYDTSAGVGCWDLSVWTGGASSAGARVMAAMLAGSGDLAEVPLVLRPAETDVASQLAWTPSLMVGTDAVAAVARPPFVELPGVRVTPRPAFDQNVEDHVEVRLGSVLDATRAPAAPFGVSLDSINRHVFVSGATGAGKSETVRALLRGLNQRRIPWLVIEPAKAEYAALAPWLDPRDPVVVIRPGDPHVPPPMINPLEPSSIVVGGVRHTFPLQTHLDMVKALFTASFNAQEPFPQVLSAGLTGAYRSRGWNLVTGGAVEPSLSPPEWPVLGDLVRESLAVVEGLGYAADVRNNMRGFIRVRVESLRSGTPGRFFEGGYPIDLEDLLRRPAVLEIEDLGDDHDKAFFIGNLIIRTVEHLRLRQKHGLQPSGLSHVLVIEEAHRLLRRVAEESPSAHAVTLFANLLAEIRSYGEGVVVAEQIPSKVIPDLVKNSAVKLMHRLPAQDDREAVGATMNLDAEQSSYVVALEPGTVVAHSAGMDRPVLARIERVAEHASTGAGTSRPMLGARLAAGPGEASTAPLTLTELEVARALAGPAVSLWAEHVVVAHLTHDPLGTPQGPWFDDLRGVDPRLSRAAVGLSVADAVGRRRTLVRRWHDPAGLAAAAAELMVARLEKGAGPDLPKWRWSIAQFRIGPVLTALEDSSTPADREAPHPRTGRWSAGGIDLPGPAWSDQRQQLEVVGRSMRAVMPHQLAGEPQVLDEVARALGFEGGTELTRIARALRSLGLEHRRMVIRVGAQDE